MWTTLLLLTFRHWVFQHVILFVSDTDYMEYLNFSANVYGGYERWYIEVFKIFANPYFTELFFFFFKICWHKIYLCNTKILRIITTVKYLIHVQALNIYAYKIKKLDVLYNEHKRYVYLQAWLALMSSSNDFQMTLSLWAVSFWG